MTRELTGSEVKLLAWPTSARGLLCRLAAEARDVDNSELFAGQNVNGIADRLEALADKIGELVPATDRHVSPD